MTATPVSWRPENEDDLNTARSWLEPLLADWEMRWAGRSAFVVKDVTRIPPGQPWPHHEGMVQHPCTSGIRLDLSADADRLWIETIYAVADSVFASPNCHGALKSIGADMRDEWIEAIRSSCDPALTLAQEEAERNRYGVVQLRIASTGGVCVAFVICDIRHIWARAPLPATTPLSHAQQMPVSRRTALDDSTVTLSAWLGSCDLSAAALATLSVGDVLTLDQPLDVPLILSVDDSAEVATGIPGCVGGALSFQLVSLPPSSLS